LQGTVSTNGYPGLFDRGALAGIQRVSGAVGISYKRLARTDAPPALDAQFSMKNNAQQ
jgi:hypothetical protein